ncbi:hypothetical protein [Jeotgalibacillus marinus]|uniref:Uncharacterized protein n=1 Tax=Jeotgalibacillus marinus TaxID=86667 RepID=A0ABV3Q1A3_9BACL
MTFTSLFLFYILTIVSVGGFYTLRMYKNSKNIPLTYSSSFIAMGLLTLNWLLFLTNFYSKLPVNLSEVIFLPIWFSVSILGLITSLFELRNNRLFALLPGIISFISFLIGIFLYGLSKM